MANTLLTNDLITNDAVFQLKPKMPLVRSLDRPYEDMFSKPGLQPGDSHRIRKPVRFVGGDGDDITSSIENLTEEQVTITLEPLVTVGFQATSREFTLEIDQFSDRFVKPAMTHIGAKIESRAMKYALQGTGNRVGTPGTVPTTLTTYLQARQKIVELGAGNRERKLFVTPEMETSIVNAFSTLENPRKSIAMQYLDGYMRRAAGADWFETTAQYTHAVGAFAGTPLVNGASQDGASLITSGWSSGAADAYGKEVGQFISNDRKIQDCTIWQYFSNGYEVLEDQIEWLDNLWIPIIPVFGKELWVGGKRRFVSIIEDSHDPQRFLNYMVSESAETVALTPKTPYVAAAGQVEDHPEWQDANHKTYDVLTYDPIGVNGKFLPPPQRQNMEPAIAGLSMLTEQAKTFVMSTHGIPKAGFGEKDSGHDSGRALLALQREGDTANFHIHDNLARAVEHGYRILVRIMPKMIDVERQIRIVGEDEAERVITVNRQLVEGGESQAMVGYENKDGERVEAVLDAGMFDVRVSTGPAAATQRLEDSRTLIEVGKMFPALMEVAPDLVIRSLDLKDGDKLAERFTPPQFKEGKDGQKPLPPEVQQAMQQAQQMVDALTEKVNQLEDEKQAKRWDYEGKREIEAMRLASNEMISNADNKIKATIEAWKLDMAEATQLLQAAMRDMEALRQPGPVGAS